MLQEHNILANALVTRRLLDELGKIFHARRLTVVLADAATQGFFAYSASQHLAIRAAVEASVVVHSARSLKTVLNVDASGQSMDDLPLTVGVEMARNALDLSQAQLAIAMTLGSGRNLALPQCTVLGLHWWYRDQEDTQSSWMLSQQLVVVSTREELPSKLVQLIAHETIKVLRLQEAPALLAKVS